MLDLGAGNQAISRMDHVWGILVPPEERLAGGFPVGFD
jgi:hypothetical protein